MEGHFIPLMDVQTPNPSFEEEYNYIHKIEKLDVSIPTLGSALGGYDEA